MPTLPTSTSGFAAPCASIFHDRKDYCGLFRTPSLRNVARRQSFFHNGVFHTLKKAVAFYARRDTNPEEWYPRKADGTVDKLDDLPTEYRENLNLDPHSTAIPATSRRWTMPRSTTSWPFCKR